ncbi:MAG: hypothetical protein H7244_10975 [Herminiimonas sp.]|nr:hypothetical protein [Herminiimonas sp.]
MLSTVKIAQLAHVGALKIFAAKTAIGAGMIAGTAATGFVAYTGLPPDYLSGASELINRAVMTEASTTAGAPPRDEGRPADPQSPGPVDPATASPLGTSVLRMDQATPDMPQVVITARRMTAPEKLAYDSAQGLVTRLAAISARWQEHGH